MLHHFHFRNWFNTDDCAKPLDSWQVRRSRTPEWATWGYETVSHISKRKRHLLTMALLEREAFRWVQKYIGQFGGDPTKVTM